MCFLPEAKPRISEWEVKGEVLADKSVTPYPEWGLGHCPRKFSKSNLEISAFRCISGASHDDHFSCCSIIIVRIVVTMETSGGGVVPQLSRIFAIVLLCNTYL